MCPKGFDVTASSDRPTTLLSPPVRSTLPPMTSTWQPRVVLLTGGLGGARLAPSLRDALDLDKLTVIANVGDDLTWHGLRVCPDLDSVTYSLAGLWDSGRGWGLKDETFRVRDALVNLDTPA